MVRYSPKMRGALMLTLSSEHPDLPEFIDLKANTDRVTKANISIRVSDEFMKAVEEDKGYMLYFYREETGETIRKIISARRLFERFVENNWNYAEPGLLFWDRIKNWSLLSNDKVFKFAGTNPCFTGDMKLLTVNGYKSFKELNNTFPLIINKDGEISKSKVWCNGYKNTVKIKFYNKDFEPIICTPDHKFMLSDGKECEAKDLKGKQIKQFVKLKEAKNEEFVKFGFIQGDGNVKDIINPYKKTITVNIGKKDTDILKLFDLPLDNGGRTIQYKNIEILKQLGFDANKLPTRILPSKYNEFNIKQKADFLQGLFSANGSVITNHRISFKSTSYKLIVQLKETLYSDFNIDSYITTNKEKTIKFSNGEYKCKENYDLNINRIKEIIKFAEKIGFYHRYKKQALLNLIDAKSPKVMNVKDNGKQLVYDFTEPKTHWGVVNNMIVHNCGEEPLPAGGSCLLSAINLSEYVINPFENPTFDYDSLKKDMEYYVKAMNEVLDEGLELHPLEIQRESVRNWRQIGIGIMGYADMLIKMEMKYGSLQALELTKNIGHLIKNEALRHSALLAKEYGTYPMYNKEAVLKSEYLKDVDKDVLELIKKYGLRNSQLLTVAPTGTISTMFEVSGGIEPIFAFTYKRKTESLHGKDIYYDVDTKIVRHYKGFIKDKELPDYFVSSKDIYWKDRVDTQAIWQQYIDASISSTVNLPKETTKKDIYNLYIYAWKEGLKGITVYRSGCKREGILTTEKNKEEENNKEVIRPRSIPCDIHNVKINGEQWTVIIGLLQNKPYEIFTFKNKNINILKLNNPKLIKEKIDGKNHYHIESDGIFIRDLPELYETGEEEFTTRLVSRLIRLGKINIVIKDADKTYKSIGTFVNVIKRILSKYVTQEELKWADICPECGAEMIYEGGCAKCPSCGYSKCG